MGQPFTPSHGTTAAEQPSIRPFEPSAEDETRVDEIPLHFFGEAVKLAQEAIATEYRRLGSNSRHGLLGQSTGKLTRTSTGFKQRYEYGVLHTRGGEITPEGVGYIMVPPVSIYYVADIYLAAAKCFGSEDPGDIFGGGEGEDEPYVIATAVTSPGAFLGETFNVVRTWRSPTFTKIKKGSIFAEEQLMFKDLIVGPDGIQVKLALMDHEHGDEEALHKLIADKGDEMAREAIGLAGTLAGVNIEEAQLDQALDSALLRTLGAISVGLLTHALSDDIIGEKTWRIDGNLLRSWADDREKLEATKVEYPGELPSHILTNFPYENIFDGTRLFSGGGGSYKLYLRVIPKRVVTGPQTPQH